MLEARLPFFDASPIQIDIQSVYHMVQSSKIDANAGRINKQVLSMKPDVNPLQI